ARLFKGRCDLMCTLYHKYCVFNSIYIVLTLFEFNLINRVFFVLDQKVHPSGQQIYPQLLRYRAFAGSEDSGRLLPESSLTCFMPGVSTCEKLCW
ncbi:MAG: hypothetical protein ACI8ZB_004468, partial [Desulforhopalus sp.]